MGSPARVIGWGVERWSGRGGFLEALFHRDRAAMVESSELLSGRSGQDLRSRLVRAHLDQAPSLR